MTTSPAGNPMRFRVDISLQMLYQRKPYTIIKDCLFDRPKPLFSNEARDRSRNAAVIKNFVARSASEAEIFPPPRYYSPVKKKGQCSNTFFI